MKKAFLFSALILVVAFTACGPAAENREKMMSDSKVFQDSIAKMLKTSIDEAAQPGPAMGPPVQTGTTAATPPAPAK